jgi:hypothetical protein
MDMRSFSLVLLLVSLLLLPIAARTQDTDGRPDAPPDSMKLHPELDSATDSAATSKAAPAASARFDRTLELQGIRFRATSSNDASVNTLRIVPGGLEIDNSPIVRTIEGTVTGAEVADLNRDGSPEFYVYVTSAGSGSYGALVAYSANRRKSLSEIYLPPVTQNKTASKGYMGHDKFVVVGNVLVQQFPVYRDTDTNAKPTGGTR